MDRSQREPRKTTSAAPPSTSAKPIQSASAGRSPTRAIALNRMAVRRLWADGTDHDLGACGSTALPDAFHPFCHLDRARLEPIARQVEAMAGDGLRVLVVARAIFPSGSLPGGQHDFDFEFVGLVALEDPVRPDVPAAIAECRAAGIRFVMITGDHPQTALSIARQAGLVADGRTWTRRRDSRRPWNAAFGWIAIATCVLLALTPLVPVVSSLFGRARMVRVNQVARRPTIELTGTPVAWPIGVEEF